MFTNKTSPTFGDQLEAPLSTAELATNAPTWRHIWYVQRFLLHGAEALMLEASVQTKTSELNIVSLLLELETPHEDDCPLYQRTGSLMRAVINNTRVWLSNNNAEGLTLLAVLIREIHKRCLTHDQSKLLTPEVELFTANVERLAFVEFGRDEYLQALRDLRPALEHHYAHNRHHPEHFERGVYGMTLIDLMEMYCDWLASSLRTKGGDIYRSFEVTKDRFGLTDDLIEVLVNTHERFYTEQYRRDPLDFSYQI